MTVTISGAKPFNKNTLRGFFDVTLDSGMKINGCTLHEDNGSRWVGLPGQKYTKPDGSTSWTPVVEIKDRAARDKFNAAIVPPAAQALGL